MAKRIDKEEIALKHIKTLNGATLKNSAAITNIPSCSVPRTPRTTMDAASRPTASSTSRPTASPISSTAARTPGFGALFFLCSDIK